MIKLAKHITFNEVKSWPESLIELLNSNQNNVLNYISKERDNDKMSRTDLSARENPIKTNEYRSVFDKIIIDINHILDNKHFIGFHCTRLLNNEIDNILKFGPHPLSIF